MQALWYVCVLCSTLLCDTLMQKHLSWNLKHTEDDTLWFCFFYYLIVL